jgi:hypothetical protein
MLPHREVLYRLEQVQGLVLVQVSRRLEGAQSAPRDSQRARSCDRPLDGQRLQDISPFAG